LENKQKESGQEISHSRWEASKTQTRLISQLGLRRDEVPSGRLAVDFLRKTAKEGLARVAAVHSSTDVSNLDSLRTARDAAEKQANDLAKELAVIDAQIPEMEKLLSAMRGELPGYSVSLHKADNPQCPICEVPIDLALAEGCKLSHKLPNAEEIRCRRENLQKEILQESGRLQHLKDRQSLINHGLPNARQYADELKKQVSSVEQAREARADAWYMAKRLIDEAGRLDELLIELERSLSSADKMSESIVAKREQAGAFRNAQANVFHRLSHFFDAIIHQVAGTGAEGKTTLDGNGLHLSVKLGGERSSPAIDSLKVIVFDLAVLCMSIEGRTHIPAFLIHDSPREADLGLSIYHQLFYLMQSLEQVGGQPLFQYIVTTTTRPPEELLEEPWLRDILGGAPAEARLLRRDL
jgi:predicted  nucleic acid-binding Zn-ribbon protein